MPTKDPKKQRATIEQMSRLHAHLQQLINNLQKSVSNSFTQQFQNIQSLAGGLDSAEFNLRSQQKVINGLALDQLRMFQVLDSMASDFNKLAIEVRGEDTELYKDVLPVHVQYTDIKDEEGNIVDRRVDWPFYHEEVQKDKEEIQRLMKEQEEQAKAELEKAKAEADEKQIQEEVEKVKEAAIEAGNDPEEVAEEAEKLLRETKAVADETGKMMRGEPFDEEVIAEAQKKIAEDEAQNEASEFPKGASIFGG